LTHTIQLVLVLFVKFFDPFFEKSTRHCKTEKKHLDILWRRLHC